MNQHYLSLSSSDNFDFLKQPSQISLKGEGRACPNLLKLCIRETAHSLRLSRARIKHIDSTFMKI